MTAGVLTVVSGVLLLVVFALVGWNLGRRADSDHEQDQGDGGPSAGSANDD